MKDTKQQWFKDAKYGLFIHWGLYSLLAGEYKGTVTAGLSEWIMNDLQIPVNEYEPLAARFDPIRFDADELVRRAKEDWGMKYIVFTSKHHEGFAMYHSACDPYNVYDASPCRRDILKELSEACAKYGMPLGLYYSQAQDWHEEGGLFGYRDNSYEMYQSYLDKKVMPQLRELLTGYGRIAILWFDTPLETTLEQAKAMVDLVKSLQPSCIISGRIGNKLGEYMTTGDNFIPRLPYEGDWEVPATLNDTWGYSRHDTNWKDPKEIIRLLIKINSCGGNYLLNVGPDSLGVVPDASIAILDTVGKYVNANAEAIFGTLRMPLYPYELTYGGLTCRPYRLYVHVFRRIPLLELLNITNTIKRAWVVETGEELIPRTGATCEGDGFVRVDLPEHLKRSDYYCVALELGEEMPLFHPIRD